MATRCPQGAFTRCGGSCLYSVVRGHVCSCDRCSLDLDPQPRYQMELLLDDGFVAELRLWRSPGHADRLSRSHADIRTILHVLEEWGVQCVSLEQLGYLQALLPAVSE